MVGIAHALLSQQQEVQLPIMHLRTLNPMVASMLETSAAAGSASSGLHMPRQGGPAALAGLQDGGVVLPKTGVSAFAFQVRTSFAMKWLSWLDDWVMLCAYVISSVTPARNTPAGSQVHAVMYV
jgi:hypothetical protein